MRLFRVVRTNPPTLDDFKSHAELGRRRGRHSDERSWRAVSTFVSVELATEKARTYRLGTYLSELEVPDSIQQTQSRTGHVDLEKTTPEELIGYVIRTFPI